MMRDQPTSLALSLPPGGCSHARAHAPAPARARPHPPTHTHETLLPPSAINKSTRPPSAPLVLTEVIVRLAYSLSPYPSRIMSASWEGELILRSKRM
jgi:hypothetical protein